MKETTDKRTGAAKKRDAERGVCFGCHVDLFNTKDEKPDGCVLDDGMPESCMYAKGRREKWTCPYWAPIKDQPADPLAAARAEGFRAGAEAMREVVLEQLDICGWHGPADIRSLDIPEYKP